MLSFTFISYVQVCSYLVCILFGVPSLQLFTFLMFYIKECVLTIDTEIDGQ